jgi:hypothetical protein
VTRPPAGPACPPHPGPPPEPAATGDRLAEATPALPQRLPARSGARRPGPGAGWKPAPEPWTVPPARRAPSPAADGPAKPTVAELGVDPGGIEWERSGEGHGRIEVAFPLGPAGGGTAWQRGEWVLMRVAGDPDARVLVFDRNEWVCFLDGARNGEFDDAAPGKRP